VSELNRTHDFAPGDRSSESAALFEELMQLQSLSHEQVERIHQLEQALDQSLTSIEELRQRIVHQEFLEAQLASTEEIANVQQQAIARLKLQLGQKPSEPQPITPDQALQDLMGTMAAFAEAQQIELQKLRSRIARDRAELQSHRGRSVSKVATAPISSPSFISIKAKLEELEQTPKHSTSQALLQHTCQELEAERERQHTRIAELEKQAAEMQEQILRQAQHITEQETAVQHWKDRYLSHQEQTQRLAVLLQSLPPLSPEVTEILASLQAHPHLPASPTLALVGTDRQNAQLDLPEFLMRRRRYTRRATPAD